MSVDRRKFIKVAGLTSLGLAASPAVELFARVELGKDSPLVANSWAMVIDLKKCLSQDGCTKCIAACHKTHNVPDIGNVEEEIKWIWKESFQHAFHSSEHEYLPEEMRHGPALVLCNHCKNAPCVKVCPTQATWKREKDGIVMMDWHRCIGCRYCMVACPYGSRSFNWHDPRKFMDELQPDFPTRSKGVVEKCTFCEERLARGKQPACVVECPEHALVFGDLDDPHSEVRQLLESGFSIRRKPGLGTEPQVYYLV